MRRFDVGDRVRIDIPEETDPDHKQYHGLVGEVMEVLEDGAEHHTGDERDSYLFAVELENGDIGHFRWRDLRPYDGYRG